MSNSQHRSSTWLRGGSALLGFIGLVGSSACGGSQSQAQAPTATSTDETITYSVPNVTAVVGGTEMQEKKNLIVSVVPVPFVISDTPTKECVPGAEDKPSGLLSFINVSNGQAQKKAYIVTTQTGEDFHPKTLTFQIKVTNHTDQVMHLDTAIPKLNINSEDVMISDFDAKQLNSAILVPNESHSFMLAGPDWGHNPDEAIITFSLYSMPIDIDKTGTASKDNFTWTFRAKLEKKQAQSKKTVENLMLDPAEAANLNCHPGAVAAN